MRECGEVSRGRVRFSRWVIDRSCSLMQWPDPVSVGYLRFEPHPFDTADRLSVVDHTRRKHPNDHTPSSPDHQHITPHRNQSVQPPEHGYTRDRDRERVIPYWVLDRDTQRTFCLLTFCAAPLFVVSRAIHAIHPIAIGYTASQPVEIDV